MDNKEWLKKIELIYQLRQASIQNEIPTEGEGRCFEIKSAEGHYFLKYNRLSASRKQKIKIRHQSIEQMNKTEHFTPNLISIKKDYHDELTSADAGEKGFYEANHYVELYEWIDFILHEKTNPEEFESLILFLNIIEHELHLKECEQERNAQERSKVNGYILLSDLSGVYINREERSVFMNAKDIVEKNQETILNAVDKLPLTMIHGDINLKNIGFQQGKPSVILDFEKARTGLMVEDFSMLYFETCVKDIAGLEESYQRSVCFEKKLLEHNYNYEMKLLILIALSRMVRHLHRYYTTLQYEKLSRKVFLPGTERLIQLWEMTIK